MVAITLLSGRRRRRKQKMRAQIPRVPAGIPIDEQSGPLGEDAGMDRERLELRQSCPLDGDAGDGGRLQAAGTIIAEGQGLADGRHALVAG